jgi:hypothetical protein
VTLIRGLRVGAVATVALAMYVASLPAHAAINETVTFTVIPPVGGTGSGLGGRARLTCGWHSSCVSYSSRNGLDWVNGNDASIRTVNIRAKVQTSYQPGPVVVSYAKVFEWFSPYNGGCAEVVAEIWGITNVSDVHPMNVLWLHTGNNGYTSSNPRVIYFQGSWGGVTAGTSIGSMVDDPEYSGGSCGWTGYHTHAWTNSSGVTHNTSQIPTAAGPCFYSEGLPCNLLKPNGLTYWEPPANHWERRKAWTYCYSGCSPP